MAKIGRHAVLALVAGVMLLGVGITTAQAHVSVTFGFGVGWWGWAPYGYAYPGVGFGVAYAPAPQHYVQGPPRNAAPIVVDVAPKKASLFIDGEEAGQVRDYNTTAYPLWLARGTHVIEFRQKGYQTLRVKIEVRAGKSYRVHYDLHSGSGIDPRSTTGAKHPPADEGVTDNEV